MAALRYVDSQLPRLFEAFRRRRTRWLLPCPITGPVTVKMVTSIIASLTKKYIRCLINTLFSKMNEQQQISRYVSYMYSYPHKTAYRTLTPPVSLSPYLERLEGREASLYFHIPSVPISVAIAIFFHSSVAMRSAFHCISTRCSRQAEQLSVAAQGLKFTSVCRRRRYSAYSG